MTSRCIGLFVRRRGRLICAGQSQWSSITFICHLSRPDARHGVCCECAWQRHIKKQWIWSRHVLIFVSRVNTFQWVGRLDRNRLVSLQTETNELLFDLLCWVPIPFTEINSGPNLIDINVHRFNAFCCHSNIEFISNFVDFRYFWVLSSREWDWFRRFTRVSLTPSHSIPISTSSTRCALSLTSWRHTLWRHSTLSCRRQQQEIFARHVRYW